MIKNKYNVIGVMSGTSLDGLDIAYVQFIFNDRWYFKIMACETIAYNDSWKVILNNLVFKSPLELEQTDKEYSLYLAYLINQFINKNNIIHLDGEPLECKNLITIKVKPKTLKIFMPYGER